MGLREGLLERSALMTIRIDKCSTRTAWYRDRVGQTLPVERFERNLRPDQGIPEDVYWCREGGIYNCINYVRASDATVLANNALTQPAPHEHR